MNWAWAASLDHIWGSSSFPIWIALSAAIIFGLVLLVIVARAEKSVANGALAVITLVSIAIAASVILRGPGEGERMAAASSLPQSVASLPALSCLDGLAGENVEAACEKALFASADATAAAVAYTGRQIAHLTALGEVNAAKSAMTPELIAVRRMLERDRYGLVAHVLATRDRCEPSSCKAFGSLSDHKQVVANMTDKTYDNLVGRYALAWNMQPSASLAGVSMTPTLPATIATAPNVPTGRPTNADFPTAASIPPVNIMGTEPPLQPPTAARATPGSQAPPAPSSRPPATTAAVPGASPAQPAKRLPQKQQRTNEPVQLAPPAQPDDN